MSDIRFYLDNNINLNMETKVNIESIIRVFNSLLSQINCPINEDNTYLLLSNIAISEEEVENINYDSKNNKIVVPDAKKYNYAIHEDRLNHEFIKTMLDVITSIHNEDGTISKGVTFDVGDQTYGNVINEVISDRIIELTFGNPDYIVDADATMMGFKDGLFRKLEEVFGTNKLLTYYLNGRGIDFYADLSQKFGSEERALNLLSTMEKANTIEPSDMGKALDLRKCEFDIDSEIEILKNMSKNNKFTTVA